ncbi:MAG: HAD family hydrolase [Polyangiales bacterium]
MQPLPRAILFDLDDTLISAYRNPERAWLIAAEELSAQLQPFGVVEVVRVIMVHANAFWADPDRHRHFRMRLQESRRLIVRGALEALAAPSHPPLLEVSDRLADRFTRLRDEEMHLFPDAHAILDALKQTGVRLALVTNGPSELQRGKIARFDLERRFDHIQIEGEHGFGKPDARAYLHAMQMLAVTASDTWMVGDNLEWEVAGPQRLGIHAVWHDVAGNGLPAGSTVRPDRTIRALRELLPPVPSQAGPTDQSR